jgi:GNAT superfamily N-acetyltransferase
MMTSSTDQPPAPDSSDNLTTEDVVLSIASPHQRELSWRLNSTAWAGPMTFDQYLGRETAMAESSLSRDGGTIYFVLHPRNDPETIVSSCEVVRKRALVTLPGHGTTPYEAGAYGIASVFTNPRFRGRGMASHMLRKVQEYVDGELKTMFGVLYSDIGREYYSQLGWKDFPSPQLLLTLSDARKSDGDADASSSLSAPGSVMLGEDEALTLCDLDVKLVFHLLVKNTERGGEDGKARVAFLPNEEQISWHFTRDKYVCKVLAGREVVNRGARTENGFAWIIWDHDLREKKLKILRLVEDCVRNRRKDQLLGDVKTLLRAALVEAQDWGLSKVLVWNPSPATATAAAELWSELQPQVQVTLEERDDGSIPSLRWREGRPVDNVVWELNEYYAWC